MARNVRDGRRAAHRAQDAPRRGERFVREIPEVNFGPFFLTVRRVYTAGRPHVTFECIGPDGCQFRRLHREPLPLPPSVRREDWTEQDVHAIATGGTDDPVER